ncbi:hypothetical protein AWC38_SpisGene16384 [Stylophora pistillata]|uniref:Peptidase A2 domain-containing protein n=1 Tax=Stylophora pistillata TaxID=50429 RepID=A0A2B4RQZ8_STYPI|nr:hypothetical protein AWC38_SpisGene16384 [Stylophora pistillata]
MLYKKPLMKLVDRHLSGGSCNADKLAFSKVKPVDISVDERIDLAQHVIVKDNCQTSPKHSSSHPPQSGRQKQGACLESSIVSILSIVLTIVIKDKTPECLCKVSKEELASFKSVVLEENSLVFEQVDIFNDDVLSSDNIVISEVIWNNAKQNKVPDGDKTSCSDYSPLTDSNLENGKQGPTSLSVSRTLNNFGSRAEANSFVQPVSNYVEDKVNDISTSFAPGSALLPDSIKGHNFQCLTDSGAAVTAVSANVWRKHLCYAYPELGEPDSESVTTVNGSRLTTVGKTLTEFLIDSRIFTFKIDFKDGLVSFPSEPSPFPFEGVRVDDYNDLIDKAFIFSVHVSHTFVILPQSEILISGELEDSSNKYGIDGMIVLKPDLSHRYSISGASELVGVAEDGTIPIRLVNPSFKPVKIYRGTRLASFEEEDRNIATFELNAREKLRESHCSLNSDDEPRGCDYSQLPDLSDSVLSADDKIKFRDLLSKYRDVFAFSDAELDQSFSIQSFI